MSPLEDYPLPYVKAMEAEAHERTDDLLRMWVRGQRAEQKVHRHFLEHGSFDSLESGALESAYVMRQQIVRDYAFSVTTKHALQTIAKFAENRGVVSVGAGLAWWEHRLAVERGVDVLCFDAFPPPHADNFWFAGREPYMPVKEADEKIAAEYPERVLFLAWPGYGEPWAREALLAYGRAGGQLVVYVGEHEGGCCADDEFFSTLSEAWAEVGEVSIPQWPGLHDYVTIYEPR